MSLRRPACKHLSEVLFPVGGVNSLIALTRSASFVADIVLSGSRENRPNFLLKHFAK